MDCVKCITNGIDLNRKMAKAVLFGAILLSTILVQI